MEIKYSLSDSDGDESIGPATDLVVSILAVLLLMLFITRTSYLDVLGGKYDFSYVTNNQTEVVNALSAAYRTRQLVDAEDDTRLILPISNDSVIRIATKATVQRLSFGNGILFEQNSYRLSRVGQQFLDHFAGALRPRLHYLSEIKIEGHADTTGDSSYNLELAGRRAQSVFEFFQTQRIDPVKNLMSASTFGYYSPSTRNADSDFSINELRKANRTANDKGKNRRIELVLIYKLAP